MSDKPNLQALLKGIRERYEKAPDAAHLEYAQWRTEAAAEHRHRELASKGGTAAKRRKWAEQAAEYLAGLGVSFPKAWAIIPEDENEPLELDQDAGIYRSNGGEKLVAVDLVTENELGEMSRSNFEKRYFRPARKNPDSN